MALATHQLQGSSSSLPSVSSSWSRGIRVKHSLPTFRPFGGKDLKCRSCSSVGSSLYLGPKSKVFRISAFKGGSQRDDSSGRANGPKSRKNPAKVSYLQNESEESSVESSKVQNVGSASPYTSADESTTRSLAIQNLFKSWLMLLRTPPQTTEPVEGTAEEPPSIETSEMGKQERVSRILKAVGYYFLGLDATLQVPLLVITPVYFAVNLIYGPEVSKELTPFWILGPLVVAIYVKIFRAVCGFYISIFKKMFDSVMNWLLLLRDYTIGGKLMEIVLARIWQPLVDLKNTDFNALRKRKMQEWRERQEERYLEFIESIWPYYCRTIRFLKKSNVI